MTLPSWIIEQIETERRLREEGQYEQLRLPLYDDDDWRRQPDDEPILKKIVIEM